MIFLVLCLIALLGISMCEMAKEAHGCQGEPGITITIKYKGIRFDCILPMVAEEEAEFLKGKPVFMEKPLGGRLYLIEYGSIGIYILEKWEYATGRC